MKQKPDTLFEDGNLIVLHKPPGILCLPDRYRPELPNLVSILEERYGRVFVVHRIDRDTSGVVVLALTPDAHRDLSIQFSEHSVRKDYLALVTGSPEWEDTVIDLPLRSDADRRHRTRVDRHEGKSALTRVEVLERFGRHALVRARPETGRTHQVRVHLAEAGYPIVADPLYGDGEPLFLSAFKRNYTPSRREERPLIARTALHAAALEFQYPTRDATVRHEAPLHRDMRVAVRQLRRFGPSVAGSPLKSRSDYA